MSDSSFTPCACMVCGDMVTSPDEVYQHIDKHQGIPFRDCLSCVSGFHTGGLLLRHMNLHNVKFCVICSANLDSHLSLARHMKQHGTKGQFLLSGKFGKPFYECKFCAVGHENLDELENHVCVVKPFWQPGHNGGDMEAGKSAEISPKCECDDSSSHQVQPTSDGPLQFLGELDPLSALTSLQSTNNQDLNNDVNSSQMWDPGNIVIQSIWSETSSSQVLTGKGGSCELRPYTCTVCNKTFKTNKAFHKHRLIHSPRSHYCHICHKRFTHGFRLNAHMNIHAEVRQVFPCRYCSKKFTQSYSRNVHERYHTGVKNFQCTICGKITVSNHEFQVHMRMHTGERPFQCPVCPKRFVCKAQVCAHLGTHVKQYKCDVCEKRFSYKTSLKVHVDGHTEQDIYTCRFCHRESESLSALKVHIREAHSESQTTDFDTCPVCQAELGDRFLLLGHLKKHVKEIPGAMATPEADKVETAIKPFQCHVCPKRFRTRANLNFHVKSHSGQRYTFKCRTCSLMFVSDSERSSHERQQHQPLYPCPKCFKNFESQSALDLHQLLHIKKENDHGAVYKTLPDSSFNTINRTESVVGNVHPQCMETTPVLRTLLQGTTPPPTPPTVHEENKQIQVYVENTPSPCTERKDGFKCSYCPKVMSSGWNKKVHEQIHIRRNDIILTPNPDSAMMQSPYHKRKDLKCCYCPKVVTSKYHKKLHEEAHRRKNPRLKMRDQSSPQPTCPVCYRKFCSSGNRNRHLKLFHPDHGKHNNKKGNGKESFQCRYCPRRFPRHWNMTVHEESHERKLTKHSGKNPYMGKQAEGITGRHLQSLDTSNVDDNDEIVGEIEQVHSSAVRPQMLEHHQSRSSSLNFGSKKALEQRVLTHIFPEPSVAESIKHFVDKRNNDMSVQESASSQSVGIGQCMTPVLYPCPQCSHKFISQTFLEQHLASHMSEPSLSAGSEAYVEAPNAPSGGVKICEAVSGQFSGDQQVLFSCPQCSLNFMSKAALEHHIITHIHPQPSLVPGEIVGGDSETDAQFIVSEPGGKSAPSQVIHKRNPLSVIEFSCTQCPSVLKSQADLEQHLMTHKQGETSIPEKHKVHVGDQDEESIICHICKKHYKTQVSLKRHMKYHRGNQVLYKCAVCPTTLTTKWSRKVHELRHGIALPCSSCEKTFPTQWHRDAHMKIHSVPSPVYKINSFLAEQSTLLAQNPVIAQHLPGLESGYKSSNNSAPSQQPLDSTQNQIPELNHHYKVQDISAVNCDSEQLKVPKKEMVSGESLHDGLEFACSLCPQKFTTSGNRDVHVAMHANKDILRKIRESLAVGFKKQQPVESPNISANPLYTVPHQDYTVPLKDDIVPHKDYTAPHKDYIAPHKDYTLSHKDYTVPHKDYSAPHRDSIENTSNVDLRQDLNMSSSRPTPVENPVAEIPKDEDVILIQSDVEDTESVANGTEDGESRRTPEVGAFTCCHCKNTFAAMGNLIKHLEIHPSTPPYVCSICQRELLSQDQLECHLEMHLEASEETSVGPETDDEVNDESVGFISNNVQDREETNSVKLPEEDFCETPRPSRTHDNVPPKKIKRKKVSSKKKPFQCHICQFRAVNKSKLDRHIAIHDENRTLYPCRFCSKKFPYKYSVTVHEEMHSRKKYMCDLCERCFVSPNQLNAHQELKHKVERFYPCPMCGISLATREAIQNHMRTEHASQILVSDGGSEEVEQAEKEQVDDEVERSEDEVEQDEEEDSVEYNEDEVEQHEGDSNERKQEEEGGEIEEGSVYSSVDTSECEREASVESPEPSTNTVSDDTEPECCVCSDCGMLLGSSHDLKAHLETHTGRAPFSCHVCGGKFPNRPMLKRHLLTHIRIKPYSCEYCEKRFSRNDKCKAHIMNSHGEVPVAKTKPCSCEYCGKQFTRQEDCQAHIMQYHGVIADARIKLYSCKYCGKRFTQDNNCKAHVMKCPRNVAVTEAKAYSCDYCEKQFNRNDHYKAHVMKCRGKVGVKKTKVYSCDYCGKQFNRNDRCKAHVMKCHEKVGVTETKAYSCDYCEKQFTRKYNCKVHMQSHEGTRPFKCSLCEETFTDEDSLGRHVAIHTDEFLCILCTESFECSQSLKRHQLTHEEDGLYPCTFCDNVYTALDKIEAHMLSSHK